MDGHRAEVGGWGETSLDLSEAMTASSRSIPPNVGEATSQYERIRSAYVGRKCPDPSSQFLNVWSHLHP
jgi:hypothetical protein